MVSNSERIKEQHRDRLELLKRLAGV